MQVTLSSSYSHSNNSKPNDFLCWKLLHLSVNFGLFCKIIIDPLTNLCVCVSHDNAVTL